MRLGSLIRIGKRQPVIGVPRLYPSHATGHWISMRKMMSHGPELDWTNQTLILANKSALDGVLVPVRIILSNLDRNFQAVKNLTT